jgi:hypothetical protein
MGLILPYHIICVTDVFTFLAGPAWLFGQSDKGVAVRTTRLLFIINAERRLLTVLWSIRL